MSVIAMSFLRFVLRSYNQNERGTNIWRGRPAFASIACHDAMLMINVRNLARGVEHGC